MHVFHITREFQKNSITKEHSFQVIFQICYYLDIFYVNMEELKDYLNTGTVLLFEHGDGSFVHKECASPPSEQKNRPRVHF